MVAISAIREANDTLGSRAPGHVSVFVGATQGIGAGTLRELVKHLNAPKVYLLGRSKARCASQLVQLRELNPKASILFIETEVSLLSNVDAACSDISAQESTLDLLYLSPGGLTFGGPDCKNPLRIRWTRLEHDGLKNKEIDTSETLDKVFSLSYYARMRFIHNLLPLLNNAPNPRVLSVLAGGQERKLITHDLALKTNYSIPNVVDQTTTMHTLALEHIAKSNPSISFLHVYPGWVQTDFVDKFFASVSGLNSPLYTFLITLAQWLFTPIFSLFATSVHDSGQRQLFHATSPRYPSARTLQSRSRNPENAFECSVPGNGVYRVTATGETVSDAKVLGPLREARMDEKVWDHTIEVFADVRAR